MNELKIELRNQIESEGPLSIADYMNLCLTHPSHGYYTGGEPIGQSGDFITAPEVSQMFGELIGVWCMEVWQQLGAPSPFNLVELGPGRGTLMQDLLRAAKAMPEFLNAANIHLVEISPTLIKQQKQTLENKHNSIQWTGDIATLGNHPTIIIANEFLDALPFHQWVKHEDNWYEKVIGYEKGEFVFRLRPNKLSLKSLPPEHPAKPDGTIFETAPAREAFISNIAHRLSTNQGAALFLDYGHLQSGFGDTFQAVANHGYADPLKLAGKVDLTNHVDFSPLIKAAKAAKCSAPKPTTQGEFLISLGMLERADTLGMGQNTATKERIRIAAERLAKPEQMGELFKVMAFGSSDIEWPGFT